MYLKKSVSFIIFISLISICFGKVPVGLLYVENAVLMPESNMAIDFNLDWGSRYKARSGNQTHNFNLTNAALKLKYGLLPRVELGSKIGFESNSGDFLDESGFTGLGFYAKYLFANEFAGKAELNIGGNNRIYNGMDGVDLSLSAMFTSDMGMSTVHGELGFTIKGGNYRIGKTTIETGSYKNILFYGLGVEYPYTHNLSLTGEFYGHQSPIGDTVCKGPSWLAAGIKYAFDQSTILHGGVRFGVTSGAARAGIYMGLTHNFGPASALTAERRQRTEPVRYRSSQPVSSPPAAPVTPEPQAAPEPTPPPSEKTLNELIDAAANSFNNGDYKTAADYYNAAILKDSGNHLLHYNLGVVYYSMGEYQRAVNSYINALRIKEDADTRLFLGLAYYRLGDSGMAIQEWKRVLELDPGNQAAVNNLKALGAY